MGRLPLVTLVFLGVVLFAVGAINRWDPETASGTSREQVQSRL